MQAADPGNAASAPSARFTWKTAAQLAAISLAVSCAGTLGYSYIEGQGTPILEPLAFVAFTVLGAVAFAGAAAGIAAAYGLLCRKREPRSSQGKGDARAKAAATASATATASTRASAKAKAKAAIGAIAPQWSAACIALLTAVMLIFWLPWAVAAFPGIVGFDTYYQIYQCYPEAHPISAILTQFFDDAPIDAYFLDHHPIFDTLLFGAFGMASDALTGNWNLGVAAYTALQAAATACALTASAAYLRKKGCPPAVALVLYAFFCIMPFFPAYALNMGKDSLFSLLYIPYFMMLFDVVLAKGEGAFPKRRTVAWFVLLGVLLCLTKKTGLYVVVPTALIAALLYRKAWKTFLAQVLACLLVMLVVLPGIVFPLLSVAPGGKQEPLGLLFQQTAAYAQRHPAATDERAAIDRVLGYRNLREVYTFGYHDYVKWLFNQDASDEDIAAYLQAWAAMGLRDPEAYLSAFMGVAGCYLAPEATVSIDMGGADRRFYDVKRMFGGEEEAGRVVVSHPECLDGFREALGGSL